MSYFEHLVSKRPNWKPGIEPLWKLQITDQEYEKLLRYLPEKMLSNFGKSVVKEAALFFSEWWKREYSGGPHKKIDVAKKIGLENHCEDLFKLAIKGVESLRIKFIRIETTRYLDTLLLQGGLPLRALAQMYLGDGKVTLVWRDDDLNPRVTVGRKASKLMLSLILLAAEVLPFGGAVVVRMVEGDSGPLVEITATGERIKFDSEVLDALEGTCNINNLEPRTILAYYTGSLGRVIDAQMAIESSEGAVRFGFLLRS